MTLRLVETPRQPWEKRPDEDETEYLLFLGWRELPAPRPLPELGMRTLAAERKWSERATAWDNHRDMPVKPKDILAEVNYLTMQLCLLSLRRRYKEILQNPTDALSFETALKGAALFLNDPARAMDLLEKEDVDLSQYTEDEMKEILKVQNMIATKGGKR